MSVTALVPEQAPLAIDVLGEAFSDYPVMRYVIGDHHDYDQRLRTLVDFFVTARILREDVMLGAFDDQGQLAAVALVTLPGDRPPPEALAERREAVWAALGADARARYNAFGAVADRFETVAPHHHLNMIGVRRSHAGRGFARQLLTQVQRLAEGHPHSSGVTLNTSWRSNVALYEHFGYRQAGYARVDEDLEVWVLGWARTVER